MEAGTARAFLMLLSILRLFCIIHTMRNGVVAILCGRVNTEDGGVEEAADLKSTCLNSIVAQQCVSTAAEKCEQKHSKLTPEENRGQAEGGWWCGGVVGLRGRRRR